MVPRMYEVAVVLYIDETYPTLGQVGFSIAPSWQALAVLKRG